MDEPEASIHRLMERISVSKDKATILLVMNGWNEQKFNTNFLLSAEYALVSSHFVTNPQFNTMTRPCDFCPAYTMCRNIGCGHSVCGQCFENSIESKIRDGKLMVLCPNQYCKKLVSNEWMLQHVSAEAKRIYDLSLKVSQPPRPVQATGWRRVLSLTKTIASSLLDTSRVEVEKCIFHMFLAVVLKKVLERRNP